MPSKKIVTCIYISLGCILDHEVSASRGIHIFKAFIFDNKFFEEVPFLNYHGAILVF